jgi:hypothetical protein
MNPNEIIAQQQAMLNQLVQHSQQMMWFYLVFGLAGPIISGWVIYMFYARLRDIADELRQFRIAYEMAQDRKATGS